MTDTILTINILCMIFGFLSIIMNSLLLWACYYLAIKKLDIVLVMILAVVDMLIPFMTIIFSTLDLNDMTIIRNIPHICSIIGSVNYILIISSIILVTGIALFRWSFVAQQHISKTLITILTLLGIALLILIIIAAANKEFSLTEDFFKCNLNITNSTLASATLFMLGFLLFSLISVTLVSYIKLMFLIIHRQSNVNNETENKPINLLLQHRRSITMRVCSVLFLYFIFVVPACFILMGQGLHILTPSLPLIITNYVSLYLTTFTNPCLVLFTHTTIRSHLLRYFHIQ